ncbi:uncharacterized protein V1518DRAFT_420569 [Limtongia smithiae]|uniref:uncharacterized protein n=1 Tax=Limtongia smithiae TaxID=1125753 RepID=UPI0034CD414C
MRSRQRFNFVVFLLTAVALTLFVALVLSPRATGRNVPVTYRLYGDAGARVAASQQHRLKLQHDIPPPPPPLYLRAQSALRDACDNPYADDGFLFFPSDDDLTMTQWVPYSAVVDNDGELVGEIDDPDPVDEDGTRYFPDGPLLDGIRAASPHNWLRDLMDLRAAVESGMVEDPIYDDVLTRTKWVRDKTVLVIGDSVDRYLTAFLCRDNLGGINRDQFGYQTTQECHVPWLNFTIIAWHTTSMIEARPKWWWIKSMKTVVWEERWEEYFERSMTRNVTTADGGVTYYRIPFDLVIFQSGLWDLSAFVTSRRDRLRHGLPETEQESVKLNFRRALNYRELRFYLNRLSHILSFVQSELPNAPMLCRTISQRSLGNENTMTTQLARAQAYVCKKHNLEMMPFEETTAGVFGAGKLYLDTVHYKNGPLSALYSNMILSYLFRAAGGVEVKGKIVRNPTALDNPKLAWDRCHQHFMQQYYI